MLRTPERTGIVSDPTKLSTSFCSYPSQGELGWCMLGSGEEGFDDGEVVVELVGAAEGLDVGEEGVEEGVGG